MGPFSIMDIQTVWKIVSEVVLPIIMAYAAYLHRAVSIAMNKIESLENKLYEDKLEAAKTYVTRQALMELDAKMTRVLERIDDKVSRILEERK